MVDAGFCQRRNFRTSRRQVASNTGCPTKLHDTPTSHSRQRGRHNVADSPDDLLRQRQQRPHGARPHPRTAVPPELEEAV